MVKKALIVSGVWGKPLQHGIPSITRYLIRHLQKLSMEVHCLVLDADNFDKQEAEKLDAYLELPNPVDQLKCTSPNFKWALKYKNYFPGMQREQLKDDINIIIGFGVLTCQAACQMKRQLFRSASLVIINTVPYDNNYFCKQLNIEPLSYPNFKNNSVRNCSKEADKILSISGCTYDSFEKIYNEHKDKHIQLNLTPDSKYFEITSSIEVDETCLLSAYQTDIDNNLSDGCQKIANAVQQVADEEQRTLTWTIFDLPNDMCSKLNKIAKSKNVTIVPYSYADGRKPEDIIRQSRLVLIPPDDSTLLQLAHATMAIGVPIIVSLNSECHNFGDTHLKDYTKHIAVDMNSDNSTTLLKEKIFDVLKSPEIWKTVTDAIRKNLKAYTTSNDNEFQAILKTLLPTYTEVTETPNTRKRYATTSSGNTAKRHKNEAQSMPQEPIQITGTDVDMSSSENRSILIVNDRSLVGTDELSTLNRSVCRMAVKTGYNVYITTLHHEKDVREQCIDYAKNNGIILLLPKLSKKSPEIDWLNLEYETYFSEIKSIPNLAVIIGYVGSTSGGVIDIRKHVFGEKKVKIVLIDHGITEIYTTENILGVAEKNNNVSVIAIGNSIHSDLSNVARGYQLPQPRCLYPLPDNLNYDFRFTKPFPESRPVILTLLNTSQEVDCQGFKVVTEAINNVANHVARSQRYLLPRWQIRLSVEGSINTEALLTSSYLNIDIVSSSRRLTTILQQCHLVIIPDSSEQLSVVGLSIIAAGIPVILAERSGLGVFLRNELRKDSVKPIMVDVGVNNISPAKDVGKWEERIIESLYTNYARAFERADDLKNQIAKCQTLSDSLQQFVEICHKFA